MQVKYIKSKIDNTIKYLYSSNNNIIESSYINKKDGKDIVCVSSQTSCNLGCKFCFLTGSNIPVRSLSTEEICFMVDDCLENSFDPQNKTLIISFMGCGEPLLNIDNIIEAMNVIRTKHSANYNTVRFAIATLIPSADLFNKFSAKIKEHKLPLKIHFSLHTPFDALRYNIMPAGINIRLSIDLLEEYVLTTSNSAEIHYSLMDKVNDTDEDITELIKLLHGKHISVKLLKLVEKSNLLRKSNRVEEFVKAINESGIFCEYYEPPGSDVGSSCGQFLVDHLKQDSGAPIA